MNKAKHFRDTWQKMKAFVDKQRFEEVSMKLNIQVKEAIWWRDACLLYFQTFSQRAIPAELDPPVHKLEELKKLTFELKYHN